MSSRRKVARKRENNLKDNLHSPRRKTYNTIQYNMQISPFPYTVIKIEILVKRKN